MNLYDSLIAKGLNAADAAAIAAEHGEPTVDTDALTKSLDGLRDSFAKGGSDTDAYIAELEGRVEESASIVEAVSKGADALLEEHKSQNDAISKAILAIGEELQSLRGDYNTLTKSNAGLSKSLGIVGAQLDEPIVKSLNASVVPSPNEAQQSQGSRFDVINKALSVMQDPSSDSQRIEDMSKAISLLEAQAPIADVVTQFGLH